MIQNCRQALSAFSTTWKCQLRLAAKQMEAILSGKNINVSREAIRGSTSKMIPRMCDQRLVTDEFLSDAAKTAYLEFNRADHNAQRLSFVNELGFLADI